LPPDQINMLIAAGRDALDANVGFRSFMRSLPRTPSREPPSAPPRTPLRQSAAPVSMLPEAQPHEARAN
jgi:hypothetical protein